MHANYLPEDPDPIAAFQDSMVGLVRALGLHRQDTTPCGQPVSVGEAQALLEVSREPGITQNGLAERLGLEKSSVSRLAGMLERRGWIDRARSATDSRFYHLRLTAGGNRANAHLATSRRLKFENILANIPEARRDVVAAALSDLVGAIRAS